MKELFRGKVTDAGRVVIPVEMRRALELSEGEEVLFSRDGQSIRITPLRFAIEEARDFFSSLPPAEAVTALDVPDRVPCEGRMSSAVLNASALMAFLRREPGSQRVREALAGSVISTACLAEVLSRALDHGASLEATCAAVARLPVEVHSFDPHRAYVAASLRPLTRRLGRVRPVNSILQAMLRSRHGRRGVNPGAIEAR